jgi:very-short-patch-repair endonuclease
LQEPIKSAHGRRLIFIPSTHAKFLAAREINDLYAGSSLEERLWEVLKARKIPADREVYVTARGNEYALDFAIYCALGRLALETDGDHWHANPEKAAEDNLRDQDLETRGWRVLHFTQKQIQEEAAKYCIDTVAENIDNLGGLDQGGVTPRRVGTGSGPYQPSLFD